MIKKNIYKLIIWREKHKNIWIAGVEPATYVWKTNSLPLTYTHFGVVYQIKKNKILIFLITAQKIFNIYKYRNNFLLLFYIID